jgi:hypothetical protein
MRQSDQIVNNCIVGQSQKRQWTWLCNLCGEGAIVNAEYIAIKRAREHKCLA